MQKNIQYWILLILVYDDDLKNKIATEEHGKNWNELDDDEKNNLIWVFQDATDIIIVDSDEEGCPAGKIMVGNRISLEDDYEETRIISVDSIDKDLKTLKDKFQDEIPCVVTGTMMC